MDKKTLPPEVKKIVKAAEESVTLIQKGQRYRIAVNGIEAGCDDETIAAVMGETVETITAIRETNGYWQPEVIYAMMVDPHD